MDILALNNSQEVIAARTTAIREAMLRESRCIRQPNFERIGTDDLARLMDLYDREFFGGWLSQARTGAPLTFLLSPRMSRAGGKTTRIRHRCRDGAMHERYEIAIASQLLFVTFQDVQRPVKVGGLICTDRLQALQRVLEHEIIHLAELLVWGESSCAGQRFEALAWRVFGHAEMKHELVTPREVAAVRHGVRVGSAVEFEFQGRRLVGRVNRINHRATVLVEDSDGVPYSDGGRYSKFYVPVEQLRLNSNSVAGLQRLQDFTETT